MIWTQKENERGEKNKYCYESDKGHRIAICRVKGILRYVLYSPRKEWLGMYDTGDKAREAGTKTST